MKIKKSLLGATSIVIIFISGIVFQNFTEQVSGTIKDCSSVELSELLAPADSKNFTYSLKCNVQEGMIGSNDVITKAVEIKGSSSSGLVFNCNGASLKSKIVPNDYKENIPGIVSQNMLTITSDSKYITNRKGEKELLVDSPENVKISNCNIYGVVRVKGRVIANSWMNKGHTERVQAGSPRNIVFDKIKIFLEHGKDAFYVNAGREIVLKNSEITGKLIGTAIYLSPETIGNKVLNNKINAITYNRDSVGIDGSKNNLIQGNHFVNSIKGGIFVYRNCGESGATRHQFPSGNKIIGNTFYHSKAIMIGPRQGSSYYCKYDEPFDHDLKIDNYDHAHDTFISANHFIINNKSKFRSRFAFGVFDGPTEISNNKITVFGGRKFDFRERISGIENKMLITGKNIVVEK